MIRVHDRRFSEKEVGDLGQILGQKPSFDTSPSTWELRRLDVRARERRAWARKIAGSHAT
jgi:hypothetical protein